MIVGSGYMGLEYAKAAQLADIPFFVISRSAPVQEESWTRLGVQPIVGAVSQARSLQVSAAVVAVDITETVTVCRLLLEMDIPRILVEKPLSLSSIEAADLLGNEDSAPSQIHVGYNRRYFASVQRLHRILADLPGDYHVHADFSERIERLDFSVYNPKVLGRWVISNSSHVLDLLLDLAPSAKLESVTAGGNLPWHTGASWFRGEGSFEKGRFSYTADWTKSGSWSIRATYGDTEYRLSPLEELRQVHLPTGEFEEIVGPRRPLPVKAGILEQLKDFLLDRRRLVDLQTQVSHLRFFETIAGYRN